MNPTRIFDIAYYQKEQFPNLQMFSFKLADKWVSYSTDQFIQEVHKLAKGLIALGIQPQDKIALICENRVEWNIIDFAIQQVGAIVIGIYPNISPDDYRYIFQHAEIKVGFVSTQALYEKVAQDGVQIYSIESYDGISNWQEIKTLGQSISDTELAQRRDQVQTEDIASIMYTSGTTGTPKGVMLSHKNLLADTFSSDYSFPVIAYDRALSFLPVCHAYERVFHYVYMYKGLTICFAQSMETIGEDMKAVRPHIFSAVPRVLEKVYDKIMATGSQLTGIKRKLFYWSIALGEQYDIQKQGVWYALQLAIARKLVFSKWREALGSEIKGVASGSAALPEKLIRLYMAAGIPIYEGYGLTEAGPCLSVNCFKRGMKIGTVGIPLINIDIKIAEDGEILAKGDNIMVGYYKDPKATSEVIVDGWLHTGDIGQWIDGKYLKIIDRKKEMFKTSGGKYIVPQQIESKLVESRFIEQAMVIGEGERFPAALIVPNYQLLLSEFPNTAQLDRQEYLSQAKIRQLIEEELQAINIHFGKWEQIKKFALIPNEFTLETGELTPTLKMKRKVILQKYTAEYQSLFGQ